MIGTEETGDEREGENQGESGERDGGLGIEGTIGAGDGDELHGGEAEEIDEEDDGADDEVGMDVDPEDLDYGEEEDGA